MKTAAALSQENWKHYQNDSEVSIPHRTAFEILYFLVALKEYQPDIFDQLNRHPAQVATWIDILTDGTEMDK